MGTEEALTAANELQIRTNELQFLANKLQEKMIGVIDKNNTETSRHNKAIRWLTIFIVILTAVTVAAAVLPYLDLIGIDLSKSGRYALSSQESTLYVIDTKTGEIWERKSLGDINHSLGTHVGQRSDWGQ